MPIQTSKSYPAIHNGFCFRCLSSTHHSELIIYHSKFMTHRFGEREFGRIGRGFGQNGREFGRFGRGFGGSLEKLGRIGKPFANIPCARVFLLGRLATLNANPPRA
jgi:hypothetical protein